MNANQIINMVVRMVMRRLLRSGVDAGINAVGKRMNRDKTPEEVGKAPDTGETEKRMRQSMRMSRKMGRF